MRSHLWLACLAGTLAFAGVPALPEWGGSMLEPATAHARVSIAYSLDELVEQSGWAVVATALEKRSVWEHVAGSRRIVTYTKVRIDSAVYGEGLGETVWLRTLGGSVGKIGQLVAGEAQLEVGKPGLLFVVQVSKAGTYVVSGAAQGHFPILSTTPKKSDGAEKQKRVRKLALSPAIGKVIPRKGPSIAVQEVLVGSTLEEAIAKIRTAKAELDARKQKDAK